MRRGAIVTLLLLGGLSVAREGDGHASRHTVARGTAPRLASQRGPLPAGAKGKNFRLPDSVRPSLYDLTLRVDPAAKTFTGEGRVDLDLTERSSSITMHSIGHRFGRASVRVGRRTIAVTKIERNHKSESVTFHLAEPIEPGKAVIDLAWSGKVEEDGLRGIYRADTNMAVTQFEEAEARRAFPSFDEPAFKARLALKVEAPEHLTVLSNGRVKATSSLGGGVQRTTFAKTKPLSSYLLALGIGELASSRVTHAGKTPIRTYTVKGKEHLTGFAQKMGRQSILNLERYFGRRYPFGKLDQLAVPNFEAGAMENAGLVTYRETALLQARKGSTVASRKEIAETVTHENAHQWFGNLVTMEWWDDLWLNESFATWMSNKIVDKANPGWRVWLDFNRGREAAFALDALTSTHPVYERVKNAHDSRFDVITYEKGGAVLRMLESYVGEKPFRNGIRAYVKRHAYKNAKADDLWRAVQDASNQPILEVANKWIKQRGFPLVQVGRDKAGRITLAQSRFFAEPGKRAAGTWPVPLVLRYEDDDGVHEHRMLFDKARATLPIGKGRVKWMTANGGSTGYYRVAYDQDLAAGLVENLDQLDSAEKIGLLSDTWAIVRSGRGKMIDWLTLASRFGGEKDPMVLDEVLRGFDAIDGGLVSDADRPAFQTRATRLLGPELERLGWGSSGKRETERVRLRRASLISLLGKVVRSPRLEGEAAARVQRYLSGDQTALEPDLRASAIHLAAATGDEALFDAYLARSVSEPDPELKETFLGALTAFEAPTLVARAQAMLFDGKVPQQDTAGFVAGLLANRAARGPVWTQLQRDWPKFSQSLEGAPAVRNNVVRVIGRLPGQQAHEQVKDLLAKHAPKGSGLEVAEQVLERMRLGVEVRGRTQPELSAWLGAVASAR